MTGGTAKQRVPAVTDSAVRAGLETLSWTATCISQATTVAACDLRDAAGIILGHSGRVIVTGLGKSGLVGAKIAATLASTGTVASFVHAGDALHGDAGMVGPGDVVIGVSNSGATPEVVTFCAMAGLRTLPVIAFTGAPDSALAHLAEAVVDISVDRECDPYDLVPTASTSLTLALGDALAITLMVARGFTADDFAGFHPGGALGAALGR